MVALVDPWTGVGAEAERRGREDDQRCDEDGGHSEGGHDLIDHHVFRPSFPVQSRRYYPAS